MQITPAEIAETLAMVNKEHLDIRTITLGLNLRGCTDSDIDTMARKVYDRMTTAAEQLVPTAEQLEREYGIPIVNKRISVTPIAEICAATDARDLSPIAVAMDKAAKVVGVDFVGGFSALVHKGRIARGQQPHGLHPRRPRGNRLRVLKRERGVDARGHQHGRRLQDGRHCEEDRRGNRRSPVYRRR